jgi:hypothetical protein
MHDMVSRANRAGDSQGRVGLFYLSDLSYREIGEVLEIPAPVIAHHAEPSFLYSSLKKPVCKDS